VTTDNITTPLSATANPDSTAKPARSRLTAEERETILIWNDADRAWSVFSDSVRKGRIAKWLRAQGIEPTRSPEGGVEAEGIPEWAIGLRTRKRRRHPEPAARSVSSPPKPPIQRHPDGVQAAGGGKPLGRASTLTAPAYRRVRMGKLAFLVSSPEATGRDDAGRSRNHRR
jgi:hypothetical protein